jgi:hypothetical protein
MTDMIVNGDDDRAHGDRTVLRAYKALEAAVELLESTLDTARGTGNCDEAGVVKDVRAVGAAFQTALQMEGKAREAGSQRYGGRGVGELDLGAARDEIGRRLARLRAAGGDGGFPAGVE